MYKVLKHMSLFCSLDLSFCHVLVVVATKVYIMNRTKNIKESFGKITAISETGSETPKKACNASKNICCCCTFHDRINTVLTGILVWKICRKIIVISKIFRKFF